MVGQKHQVPCLKLGTDSPCRIGEDQPFCPQLGHDPGRQDHFHGVAFIKVDPSLHHHYRFPVHIPEQEPALMARHGGGGKSRNVPVFHHSLQLDSVSKSPQAGAQDQSSVRDKLRLFPDGSHALLNSFKHFAHDGQPFLCSLGQTPQRFVIGSILPASRTFVNTLRSAAGGYIWPPALYGRERRF